MNLFTIRNICFVEFLNQGELCIHGCVQLYIPTCPGRKDDSFGIVPTVRQQMTACLRKGNKASSTLILYQIVEYDTYIYIR